MQPTAPELEILKQLWKQHPLTARQLHTALEDVLGWSYSSTRKTLERMQAKALVSAASQGNKMLYTPRVEKIATLASFAQDFAQRVFELKSPLPVAMFANSDLVDEDDIEQLEKLLQNIEVNSAGKKAGTK